MESFDYDGKTFNRLREEAQLGVGRELMFINKHNNRYLWQKNYGDDDWVNAESTERHSSTLFQFSHPVLEALFEDDLRKLKNVDTEAKLILYIMTNRQLRLWDYIGKIIDELIEDTRINGKPLQDVTQSELDALLEQARSSSANIFQDQDFTFDDVLHELIDNHDYLKAFVEQFSDKIKEQLIDHIVKIIIPDLTMAVGLLIYGQTITLGVLVGVYAALILTLDLEEMKANALEYIRVYREGFSLKCRMKGFKRQFNQQHKGGDIAWTRGRYLVNKPESDSHSLDILGLHRLYFPAMFEILDSQLGKDYVCMKTAVITFEKRRTLLGSLISLHINNVAKYGHWFKQNNFNNFDIDITGKKENDTDLWAVYIED